MFAKLRLAAALALLPLVAHAVTPVTPAVTITKLEVTATPAMAAAYPTVTSNADDEILSVTAGCCVAAVELHTHITEGGILRMRKVDSVPLKAGEPVVFAPGGLHVMFIGFKKPLAKGDTLPVTFRFKNAAPQTVTFTAVDPQVLQRAEDSHTHH